MLAEPSLDSNIENFHPRQLPLIVITQVLFLMILVVWKVMTFASCSRLCPTHIITFDNITTRLIVFSEVHTSGAQGFHERKWRKRRRFFGRALGQPIHGRQEYFFYPLFLSTPQERFGNPFSRKRWPNDTVEHIWENGNIFCRMPAQGEQASARMLERNAVTIVPFAHLNYYIARGDDCHEDLSRLCKNMPIAYPHGQG